MKEEKGIKVTVTVFTGVFFTY